MERRKLLALSTAALALAPFHALRAQDSNQPFTREQLDQMLAPIALYPDALLAQVLMGATYPLEIVEAARWSQANPNLKGDAAVAAVKDKSWDVSVKSLTAFPQTLQMMSNQLDWTQKLGDAMIGQQKDVAAAVQRLRAKAEAAGNLKSTPQQKVTTQSSGGANAIVIEPANPEVMYVPYYNPAWAYGQWPYPSYPPPYYPPPPNYGAALMTGLMFGLGVAAGAAMFGGWHWGYSGGGWGNSYTTVNVNRATSISANNFNADRYRNGQWNHDPAHRDGVPYRTPAERQEFGQHRPDAQQREQFRGQLDGRGNYTQRPGENRPAENRPAENRAAENRGFENRSAGDRGAFGDINRGGAGASRDFERGSQSWGNRSWGGGGGEHFGGGGGRFGGGRR
ncbi:DUF3300 domain-containing protein [Reyranella aquatilis]|uniref:DUF3300 domain-containing protein n=1 Tax=Reyranella aquatilis TaxID=2035356 RepID=A0ABS8KU69_9HYPH|nr:DUF3300 domain-containing protein [Reyranella aquatilis]MCC8429625.1 DUF3300 domain-containing protein [Reyranella aquatilis]